MSEFNQDHIIMTTLVKIELPNRDIRICDGGVIFFQGEFYDSEDADYGTIVAGDALTEGLGDTAPAASLTFIPNSNAATEQLTSPSIQWSPVSIWIAAVDRQNGQVIRAVSLFFGFIDVPTSRQGREHREIDMTLVSDTERFFIQNEGNRLSQENHQRLFPDELGLNNMTGVEYDVPWGTESRPSAENSNIGLGAGGVVTRLFG